ncbi:hypothetical protein ABH940_006133 [Streptacidiphilus sp. BW17]|uniref:DUF2690 domain-containing protein n=1 Tax=Streptacidiphilus sp. BW17 TaxID=3156274 RepID=UPI0035179F8D
MKSVPLRRALRLLPVLALAAGVLFGPAAPLASAAGPTCNGSSCEGQNAEATGCSVDEMPIDDSSEGQGGSDLKIYYSPTCGTVWAMYTEVDATGGFGTATIFTVPDTGGLETATQQALGSQVGRNINGNLAIETGMTQWGQSFKACGSPDENSTTIDPEPDGVASPNLYGWCTGWH